MAYATLEDLRREGFSAEEMPDDRAQQALADASAVIDSVTGQFFEPRPLTLVLEGRGALGVEVVDIEVALGVGTARATAYGCDLTQGYVDENAAYYSS